MMWLTGSGKDSRPKNRVSSFRGYLLKMRRSENLFAPQWGKRWFSLEGRFLKWYRQETDISSAGMVDLKFMRNIVKMENTLGINTNTFTVFCQDRSLVLRAENYQEMTNWIRAIHIQADIARGGSGMCVVSDFNTLPMGTRVAFSMKRQSSKKRTEAVSLEAELEANLRKLLALEQELLEQSQDLDIGGLNLQEIEINNNKDKSAAVVVDDSKTHHHRAPRINAVDVDAEEKDEDDDDQDFFNQESESKVTAIFRDAHAHGHRNDEASREKGNVNSGQAKGTAGYKSIRRIESNNSIEDISLDKPIKTGRHRREARNTSKQQKQQQQQNNRYAESSSNGYPLPPVRHNSSRTDTGTSSPDLSVNNSRDNINNRYNFSPSPMRKPGEGEGGGGEDESDEFSFSNDYDDMVVRHPGQKQPTSSSSSAAAAAGSIMDDGSLSSSVSAVENRVNYSIGRASHTIVEGDMEGDSIPRNRDRDGCDGGAVRTSKEWVKVGSNNAAGSHVRNAW